ncbi:hypothetical protein MASR1M32_31690 [Rhodobacter sp.]
MFSVGWKAIQITEITGASTSAAITRAPMLQPSGRGRRQPLAGARPSGGGSEAGLADMVLPLGRFSGLRNCRRGRGLRPKPGTRRYTGRFSCGSGQESAFSAASVHL